MKALFIGGNRFFGVHAVYSLIEKGYDITIANRGNNKDPFEDKVNRIIFDRYDEESIRKNLIKKYDVVYDNICYAPNDAKKLLDNIKTEKYIFTSSSAIYNNGLDLDEQDFNPYQYPIEYGDRKDFEYNVGKRNAEAVVFQTYNIPTIAVRFPVVIGADDYTKRLWAYVDCIKNSKPINVTNPDKKTSFITSSHAGEFLSFLADKDFKGPINAAEKEAFTFSEIINIIEDITGKKAVLSDCGEDMPYNEYGNCTLNTNMAEKLGYKFRPIIHSFYSIIDKLIHM